MRLPYDLTGKELDNSLQVSDNHILQVPGISVYKKQLKNCYQYLKVNVYPYDISHESDIVMQRRLVNNWS